MKIVAAPPLEDAAGPKPEWPPSDADRKRDLELLQGRWQRVGRDVEGKVVFQQAKEISGNEETLTNRDGEDKVIYKHTVKFRLEKHGPVRVYNAYESSVFNEEKAGPPSPADFSYIYRVDEKLLLDAPAMFARRRSYQQTPTMFKRERP